MTSIIRDVPTVKFAKRIQRVRYDHDGYLKNPTSSQIFKDISTEFGLEGPRPTRSLQIDGSFHPGEEDDT